MKLLGRAAAAVWWPTDRGHRRALSAILLLAIVLRVAWVAYAAREPTVFNSGDPYAYLFHGRELAAGRGYHSLVSTVPTAFYPIGYPLFIALFAWPVQHGLLPDDVTRLVGVAQAMLGTATVLAVWVIARRLFDARVGLLAAALVALWPGLILMTASLNLETVFVALLLGAVAVIVGRPDDQDIPTGSRMLVAGTLLGLSALVRPFSLPVLGAVLAGLLVVRPRRAWPALWATALLAVPVVLILAPWVARNQREMGTTALSTNMGETFCMDHRVGALGYFTFPAECFEGFEDVPEADIERVRNDEDLRRGLRFIREHPTTELRLIFTRARYMVDGDHDGLLGVESNGATPFLPEALRDGLRWVADSWYRVMLLLALAGLPAFVRRATPRPRDRVLVLLTAAVLIAIPLELYGYTRFHIPAIPFQAIAAALTLVWIADRLPRRQSRLT